YKDSRFSSWRLGGPAWRGASSLTRSGRAARISNDIAGVRHRLHQQSTVDQPSDEQARIEPREFSPLNPGYPRSRNGHALPVPGLLDSVHSREGRDIEDEGRVRLRGDQSLESPPARADLLGHFLRAFFVELEAHRGHESCVSHRGITVGIAATQQQRADNSPFHIRLDWGQG